MFGVGQTDICIYIASILQNAGYRVCVVDNSYEQAMHYCIPHPAEKLLTITYKKIDYERLVPADHWQEKDYDYLIVDLGVWPSEEALQACGEIFLVMDCAVAQIYRYRELMKLLRDVTVLSGFILWTSPLRNILCSPFPLWTSEMFSGMQWQ